MNEIRKNAEKEETIVTAKFKMPTITKVILIYFICNAALYALACLILAIIVERDLESYIIQTSIGILLTAFLVILFIFSSKAIKSSSCTVTDKRIYGVTARFLSKRNFSYRMDMIDNVEVGSSLGLRTLVLHFRQDGAIGQQANVQARTGGVGGMNAIGGNLFVVNYLTEHSAQEVYENISKLLLSIKNDKDVQADLEMKKVEIEEKKAQAFMAMASNRGEGNGQGQINNQGGKDYIAQLKELNELKEQGILTEEEFKEKKKQLLSKE